jgi:adenylyltransferase/sulfurtransferase
LGSAATLYLAAAGVGRLGVADGDVVALPDLQRQILHRTADVGRAKTASAEETIHALNPDCTVEVFPERLTAASIRQVLRGWDVVLDCSDNFPTRFLVTDGCWLGRIPLVSAAVVRFDGQLLSVLPDAGSPCYRCFVPEPPPVGLLPTPQEAGVLGAVVGVMGTLQAVEAIKVLLGVGQTMAHRLLVYDALDGLFMDVARVRDPECGLCGPRPTITEPVEHTETDCADG